MNKLRAHVTFHLASKNGSNKLPLSLISPDIRGWEQALCLLFSLAPREEIKGILPFPYLRRKSPKCRPKVVKRAIACQLMMMLMLMMMMMMMMMTIKGDNTKRKIIYFHV